jgi:hypothetical protein
MADIKIIVFKSEQKRTPFAPEYNYYFIEGFIKNVDFNCLTKFLLKKEKEIIKLSLTNKNNISDGYTGLGNNSTTARHDKFNIFLWKNKEIEKIKKNIIKFHNIFLKELNLDIPKNLYIQCWYNVMRKGEQIKTHIHSVSENSYLGGHVCVNVENTKTSYINPVNQIQDPQIYHSENKIGKITLFQNCIPHFTDIHQSNKERITIAFDLALEKFSESYLKLF